MFMFAELYACTFPPQAAEVMVMDGLSGWTFMSTQSKAVVACMLSQ
jgi:hypothetical protein